MSSIKFVPLLCIPLLADASRAAVPVYEVKIAHTYPHDPTAFTEGLFYLNGFLYESTESSTGKAT